MSTFCGEIKDSPNRLEAHACDHIDVCQVTFESGRTTSTTRAMTVAVATNDFLDKPKPGKAAERMLPRCLRLSALPQAARPG